jgi:hypothetical protein
MYLGLSPRTVSPGTSFGLNRKKESVAEEMAILLFGGEQTKPIEFNLETFQADVIKALDMLEQETMPYAGNTFNGLNPQRKGKAFSNQQLSHMFKLYVGLAEPETRWTYTSIGKRYGVANKTIEQKLKELVAPVLRHLLNQGVTETSSIKYSFILPQYMAKQKLFCPIA